MERNKKSNVKNQRKKKKENKKQEKKNLYFQMKYFLSGT